MIVTYLALIFFITSVGIYILFIYIYLLKLKLLQGE